MLKIVNRRCVLSSSRIFQDDGFCFCYFKKNYTRSYFDVRSSISSSPSFDNSEYALKIHKSRINCEKEVKKFDKSSYLLAHYIPEPLVNSFLALRYFSIEMNRINSNINLGAKIEPGIDPVNAKLKFWEDLIYKLECDSNNRGIMIEHPVSILLADCLRQNYNINLRYLSTFLNTKKNSLNNQVPNNIESLCSYGEGTYSQLNYALQGLLLSETISPSCIKLLENSIFLKNLITDIAAHIGQSMSIATTLIRLKYFANKKNSIYLPIDLMLKKNLSQEQLLKIFQGYIDKDSKEFINISNSLSDLVFEMATVANDHLLTARSKFSKVKQEIQTILKDNSNDAYLLSCSDKWLQGVPDAIYIPFMSAIPLQIYLGKLETHNFDIINNNLETKEWRLAWKSYWNYNKRLF